MVVESSPVPSVCPRRGGGRARGEAGQRPQRHGGQRGGVGAGGARQETERPVAFSSQRLKRVPLRREPCSVTAGCGCVLTRSQREPGDLRYLSQRRQGGTVHGGACPERRQERSNSSVRDVWHDIGDHHGSAFVPERSETWVRPERSKTWVCPGGHASSLRWAQLADCESTK